MNEVDWAKLALTQSYARDSLWKFHQIYTALETSWGQEQRLRKDDFVANRSIDVLFGSQSINENKQKKALSSK